jgi:hypothetical protein
MCASPSAERLRGACARALVAAACALAACDGRAPDRAAAADPGVHDDATSQRFAHPPLFEAPPAAGPRAGSAGSSAEEVARLEKQVALLRQDVAALRAEVASGASAAQAGRRVPSPLADAGQMASAESAFRGESVDPDWSGAMADAVREIVAQVDRDHVAPRSVECRSRSCRVELAAGSGPRTGDDLTPMLDRFAQTLPRATAGQVQAADGHQATVVYLSR